MKRSDNLTGEPTYPYYFPHRVFNPKKLIPHCTTNDAHVRSSVHVVLGKYRALIHVPALYLEIFRRNAAVGCVPVLIAIDHLNRIVHIRGYALDERNLVLNGNGVGHNQRLGIVRSRANAVDRAPACFNPDKVVAQIVQLLLDPRLPRFSDGHDTNDRRDPDGNSQHRQDASHFVSEQRHQGGAQQRRVIHLWLPLYYSRHSKINGR